MHPRSALQLITLQGSTLFVSDADGHLRSIADPGYDDAELDPAPRFWMGRTTEGNVWRMRHDLPAALAHDVEQLCRAEPVAVNVADPPRTAAAIRAALHAHAPIVDEERGPAYWVPATVQAPAEAVLIEEANAHLLAAHFPWAITSRSGFKTGPLVATVVQDQAVSICFCARLNARAAEAGVETTEAARGQGYASVAVAGWAAAMRQRRGDPVV